MWLEAGGWLSPVESAEVLGFILEVRLWGIFERDPPPQLEH